MLIIYLMIPETPGELSSKLDCGNAANDTVTTLTRPAAWYASKGKEQHAKKALRLVYRDVPDLDVDAQYEILVAGIEHEREFALEQKREKWYSIFRGVDGVSGQGVVWGPVQNTEKADW